MATRAKTNDQLLARIYRQSRQDGDCVLWTGATSRTSTRINNFRYGYIWAFGKTMRVHRVVFYLLHGSWPEVVAHSCDRPLCIAPSHLWAGSQLDNIADSVAKGRMTGRPRKLAV